MTPDESWTTTPQSERDVVLDGPKLRALAHPLRVQLVGILRREGPSTASRLAEKLGLNSGATSYHLRQLASAGLVAEADDLGNKRDRWWRAIFRSTYFEQSSYESDPEAAMAYLNAIASAYAEHTIEFGYRFPTLPAEWTGSATMSDFRLRLTAAGGRAADAGAGRGSSRPIAGTTTSPTALSSPHGRGARRRPAAGDAAARQREALGRRREGGVVVVAPTSGPTETCPHADRDRRPLYGVLGSFALSLTGTRVAGIAMPWLVLVMTDSPGMTGLLALCELGPYVVAKALGGPIVDGVGPRRVSITMDCISAVVVGLIPLLWAAGVMSLPMLFVAAAVFGSVRGPGDSAKEIFIPDIAERAQLPLPRVTGLASSIERLAGTVGPAVAGALVALAGPVPALAVTSVAAVLSAVSIALSTRSLHARAIPPEGTDEGWLPGAAARRFCVPEP